MNLKYQENTGITGGFCLFALALIVAIVAACGWCWEYTVDSWLTYSNSPKDFPYWAGCLCALVPGLGQLSLAAALITWILLTFFL